LKHLVEAATGFVKTIKPSIKKSKNIWLTKSRIFETLRSGSFSRLDCLFKGRMQVIKNKELLLYADRLTLLFITHEVDERLYSLHGPLSRGQRKISLVWDSITNELSESIPKDNILQRQCNYGRCYRELLLNAGPGDILVLNSEESRR
jgi:hypothetical protein